MKARKLGVAWVVKMEAGDELMSALRGFAIENDIRGARLQGIGSLEDVVLGFHQPAKKSYKRMTFTGEFDLVAMQGSISVAEDSPFVHAHVVVCDEEFRTRSGHLLAAKVLTSAEIFVIPVEGDLASKPDTTRGANPWDL